MKREPKKTIQRFLCNIKWYRNKEVQRQLDQLYANDLSLRMQAVQSLGEIKDRRADEALHAAVHDSKWVQFKTWVPERFVAFREWDEASQRMVDGHTEPAHWETQTETLLFAALRAIAKQSPDTTVSLIAEFVRNKTYDVPAERYIRLLGEIDSEKARASMIELYRAGYRSMDISLSLKKFWQPTDPFEAVPFYMSIHDWESIVHLGKEACEPLLKSYDPTKSDSWNIIEVAGKLGDDRVVEILRKRAQSLLKYPAYLLDNDSARSTHSRELNIAARIFVKFSAPEAADFCREALQFTKKMFEVLDFALDSQIPELIPDLFAAGKRCNDMKCIGLGLKKIKNIPYLLEVRKQNDYCDLEEDVRTVIEERIQYGPEYKTQYDIDTEKMRAAFLR